MNKITKTILVILLFGVISYTNAFFYVHIHESIHSQIYRYNNISSISSFYGFLGLEGATKAMSECKDNCLMETSLAEAIGYNTALILFSLWMIALFVTLVKIWF